MLTWILKPYQFQYQVNISEKKLQKWSSSAKCLRSLLLRHWAEQNMEQILIGPGWRTLKVLRWIYFPSLSGLHCFLCRCWEDCSWLNCPFFKFIFVSGGGELTHSFMALGSNLTVILKADKLYKDSTATLRNKDANLKTLHVTGRLKWNFPPGTIHPSERFGFAFSKNHLTLEADDVGSQGDRRHL